MDDARRGRRKGSRRGQLAAPVREALRVDLDRITASDDPVAVVRAIGDAFAALDHELERFAAARLDAIARLRAAGWSYDRIAAATGLSKARVSRLSREAQAG